MARNRKNHGGAVRLGPPFKIFVLCMFFGGSGVGYVWQKNQIHQLGKQLKVAELALDRWRAENHRLALQWNAMRSPQFLEGRVKELNLDLAQPAAQQILRLTEPEARHPGSAAAAAVAQADRDQLSSR